MSVHEQGLFLAVRIHVSTPEARREGSSKRGEDDRINSDRDRREGQEHLSIFAERTEEEG